MNKLIRLAVLSVASSTGFLLCLCGCRSSMVVRDSDRTPMTDGAVSGQYALEKIVVGVGGIDEEAVRMALRDDATLKAIFKGKLEDKDSLPINVTITCTTTNVNGDVASWNNLVALCTLSLWPRVESTEHEYTLTVSSVVGSRKSSFKLMNRSWSGISPVAMVPVPGWSDLRGEDAEIKRFHVAEIVRAVQEVCAKLPDDYSAFKKDQSRYLAIISQIRQNELIAAFKACSDTPVRASILKKLDDKSFDEIPYDSTLIPYWSKLNDATTLAKVYRDGYGSLSEANRKSLIAKIADDAVLSKMVTPPLKEGIVPAESLYVKDAKARIPVYQAMSADAVKTLADSLLSAQGVSDKISNLEPVADMSVAVADKNVSSEIAMALACKVDAIWRARKSSWGFGPRWTSEDKGQWTTLKTKISPLLSDDVLVSKIKADRTLWSAFAELISDKSKVSALAYGFITEAGKSGKEKDVKDAWEMYGGDVSDDALLMRLSVDVLPLRRPAFLKIQDDGMKEKALAAIRNSLNVELGKCAERQGKMASLIAEIGNGEDLVEWIRAKSGQTDLQRKQTFGQLKGRTVVLKGDVREIGKTLFFNKLFVSLTVGKIGMFEKMNVQFNVPDSLTPTVSSWQKGETHVMRGKIASFGGVVDDAEIKDAEIVKAEDYEAAVGLQEEMNNIKWQINELDEKKIPPESERPSRFGGAIKKAAGWIRSGLDDIKASGDDLNAAAETLMGL